jgi:hypothetical protein
MCVLSAGLHGNEGPEFKGARESELTWMKALETAPLRMADVPDLKDITNLQ